MDNYGNSQQGQGQGNIQGQNYGYGYGQQGQSYGYGQPQGAGFQQNATPAMNYYNSKMDAITRSLTPNYGTFGTQPTQQYNPYQQAYPQQQPYPQQPYPQQPYPQQPYQQQPQQYNQPWQPSQPQTQQPAPIICASVTNENDVKTARIDGFSTFLFVNSTNGEIYQKRITESGLSEIVTYRAVGEVGDANDTAKDANATNATNAANTDIAATPKTTDNAAAADGITPIMDEIKPLFDDLTKRLEEIETMIKERKDNECNGSNSNVESVAKPTGVVPKHGGKKPANEESFRSDSG